MKKKEIESFRKNLLKEKERLLSDIRGLEKSSLHATAQEGSGNLSAYASHLADVATDSYEQEKSLNFMTNEEYLLQEVEDALRKIEKKGTYGKCETCGADIATKRLNAEPYARQCVECKKKDEEKGNIAPRKSMLGSGRKGRRRR